jgi:hypothetical protein
VVTEPSSKAGHFQTLLSGGNDPGPELILALRKDLPPNGSVIIWNKTFEAGRNTEMAERYPEHREYLLDINERIFDLMDIFRKGYYIDPSFKGSASIKYVLPALIPDFEGEYERLGISSGEETMLAWAAIQQGEIRKDQLEKVQNDMFAYCKLDTLAMMKIWEMLINLVGY